MQISQHISELPFALLASIDFISIHLILFLTLKWQKQNDGIRLLPPNSKLVIDYVIGDFDLLGCQRFLWKTFEL